MSAPAEWRRPSDEEWRAMLDAREDRIAQFIDCGVVPVESIEDVEAQEAEFLRMDAEARDETAGKAGDIVEFPDVLRFTSVATAPEPDDPLFTHGPRRCDLGLVLAESGKGKSFLLLSLAVGLATGKQTIPAFTPANWEAEVLTVLYVSYEDHPAVLQKRLDAIDPEGVWRKAERDGALLFAENAQPIFGMQGRTVAITDGGKRLEAAIRVHQPDVVIIDPLSGAAVLDDENSNSSLHRVAALLAELATRHECAILLSHHASKGRADVATQHMARGGSALACRARWIMTLTEPTDIEGPDLVLASIVKDSYAPPPRPTLLQRSKGGALVQVSYEELSGGAYEALAWSLAELLGTNEADWSRRTILYDAPAKHFRDALKMSHKKTANRVGFERAYSIALSNGWIVEKQTQTGGTIKVVPRFAGGDQK